jgi:hypothetical protein
MAIRVVESVKCQADLLEMIAALHAPCSFPRGLNRRQQQRNENADDRENNQQFDQCKTASVM